MRSAVYGKCICKNFRITPDWKCVDWRINETKFPAFEEQNRIMKENRAKGWFDVCPTCRCFQEV